MEVVCNVLYICYLVRRRRDSSTLNNILTESNNKLTKPFKPSPLPTASLIHLASHACNAVRPNPSAAPAAPPGSSSFQRIDRLHSSLLGTAKATSFYRATTQSGPEGEEETVVVVVVRANGGLKLMDWMINGNFQWEGVGENVIVSVSFPFLVMISWA